LVSRTRFADLVAGFALIGLSAWFYFFAIELSPYQRSSKPRTMDVSPSVVHRIEWRHSVAFWLVLGSVTVVLGAIALIVSCGRRFAERFADPS